ncbi:MAG: bifunctional 2-polyprenyl-6-hydroxyphenol methylase/3-demethylubiquinol 3-O-methyltransferase UbiG [Pseudomonadota bacterium]
MRNDLTIYDSVADHWWSDDVRWIRTLKNMVPGRLNWFDRHVDWTDARVLDLGCAGGFMAEAMHDRGATVTGIDPATNAIDIARAHAEAHGRDISYDVGVGEDLPYESAAFDFVVCVDVLEHVQCLSSVLNEVSRVLRGGGMFLFDTINSTRLARLLAVAVAENVVGLLPRGTHDPDLFIRPRDLRAELQKVGLNPGDFTGLGPRWLDRRGDFTFGQLPFMGLIYMGVAQKENERTKYDV